MPHADTNLNGKLEVRRFSLFGLSVKPIFNDGYLMRMEIL